MTQYAGTVRWAIVAHTPQPPFRLFAKGHDPVEVAEPDTLIGSIRAGGDSEYTLLIPAKVRPVLILSKSPSSGHRELAALRLVRLSKLDPAGQKSVANQEEELLFHLVPERFDLPEESAVLVSSLVRVHEDAISTEDALGSLNENEVRVLGERVIKYYGFDTHNLVMEQLQAIAALQRGRERGS